MLGTNMRCLEHNLEDFTPYPSDYIGRSQKGNWMILSFHVPSVLVQSVRPNFEVEQRFVTNVKRQRCRAKLATD